MLLLLVRCDATFCCLLGSISAYHVLFNLSFFSESSSIPSLSIGEVQSYILLLVIARSPASSICWLRLSASSTHLVRSPASSIRILWLPASSIRLIRPSASSIRLVRLSASSSHLVSSPASFICLLRLPASSIHLVRLPASSIRLIRPSASSIRLVRLSASSSHLVSSPASSIRLLRLQTSSVRLLRLLASSIHLVPFWLDLLVWCNLNFSKSSWIQGFFPCSSLVPASSWPMAISCLLLLTWFAPNSSVDVLQFQLLLLSWFHLSFFCRFGSIKISNFKQLHKLVNFKSKFRSKFY